MKLWLMLLLCFAIPLQGMASVRASHSPCSMEAGSARQSVTGAGAASEARDAQTTLVADSAAASQVDDCCNDAESAAKSGQPCKTGQECSAPAFSLVSTMRVLAVTRSSATVPDSPAVLGPPGPPATVWRPPSHR